jgi:hypothetical protein
MDLFKDHDMTIANAAPNSIPENVIELFIFNKTPFNLFWWIR